MSDEIRTPSPETIENTVAIAKLTAISERTTIDVDKLVKHIERILPVHEKLSNLKKILYASITVGTLFCSWIAVEHFELKSHFHTHQAVEIEKHKEISVETNYNKNQITYLKGVIRKK